jgi:hypothetical protein
MRLAFMLHRLGFRVRNGEGGGESGTSMKAAELLSGCVKRGHESS